MIIKGSTFSTVSSSTCLREYELKLQLKLTSVILLIMKCINMPNVNFLTTENITFFSQIDLNNSIRVFCEVASVKSWCELNNYPFKFPVNQLTSTGNRSSFCYSKDFKIPKQQNLSKVSSLLCGKLWWQFRGAAAQNKCPVVPPGWRDSGDNHCTDCGVSITQPCKIWLMAPDRNKNYRAAYNGLPQRKLVF